MAIYYQYITIIWPFWLPYMTIIWPYITSILPLYDHFDYHIWPLYGHILPVYYHYMTILTTIYDHYMAIYYQYITIIWPFWLPYMTIKKKCRKHGTDHGEIMAPSKCSPACHPPRWPRPGESWGVPGLARNGWLISLENPIDTWSIGLPPMTLDTSYLYLFIFNDKNCMKSWSPLEKSRVGTRHRLMNFDRLLLDIIHNPPEEKSIWMYIVRIMYPVVI